MSHGQLTEHPDYPLGYIDGVGPACGPDVRCRCGAWAICQCQSCDAALCNTCWWRHTHAASSKPFYCMCEQDTAVTRQVMHEAYVIERWTRGNRRAAVDICDACRRPVAGTAQYAEPLFKSPARRRVTAG